jgi:hypothetical protein
MLGRDTIPWVRAGRLDLMALIADTVSMHEHREPQARAWCTTAGLLRAVAASERFTVLGAAWFFEAGESGIPVVTTSAFRADWEALACAAWRNDRHDRARILTGLCEAAGDVPGVLVLDDVADTELAIAGPLPVPQATGEAR